MSVEDRIKELGLALPNPPQPVANYVGAVQTGNLVFVSGHGPRGADGSRPIGKLGRELTREQGYEAARLCMLGCLARNAASMGCARFGRRGRSRARSLRCVVRDG